LKLAEFAEGDIKLTPTGKRFVDMDVDQRKRMFGEQLLANIPIAAHIKRVLDERPSHRAPATRFREELEDYMSEDYAERTLRAIINLGRYGELFAYDENAQAFSYENPQ
jgi:NitT/TauT family transport system ATP-binding protein